MYRGCALEKKLQEMQMPNTPREHNRGFRWEALYYFPFFRLWRKSNTVLVMAIRSKAVTHKFFSTVRAV